MYDIAVPELPLALSVPYGLMEDAFRRLQNLVAGISPEELEFTGPAGNINSTATLIAHLARTDLDYLFCIKGAPVPPELELAYGPDRAEDETLPAVRGKTAAELLAGYRRVLDMVRDYLKSQPDEAAVRPVTVPWWPKPATVRFVLWHMAGHSMFHQGQIRRLREWYRQPAP